jgi:hypothetical protein
MNLTVNNLIEASLPFFMNWMNKKSDTRGKLPPPPPAFLSSS